MRLRAVLANSRYFAVKRLSTDTTKRPLPGSIGHLLSVLSDMTYAQQVAYDARRALMGCQEAVMVFG
jgi:hypothetical protein